MPGSGPPWVSYGAPGPGGPRSVTTYNFVQHQLAHVTNFWRQGRPAVFRLESMSDGQSSLSLTFQLPSPSETIPPPLPTSTTTLHRPPAPFLPRRPLIPLSQGKCSFPPKAPHTFTVLKAGFSLAPFF